MCRVATHQATLNRLARAQMNFLANSRKSRCFLVANLRLTRWNGQIGPAILELQDNLHVLAALAKGRSVRDSLKIACKFRIWGLLRVATKILAGQCVSHKNSHRCPEPYPSLPEIQRKVVHKATMEQLQVLGPMGCSPHILPMRL